MLIVAVPLSQRTVPPADGSRRLVLRSEGQGERFVDPRHDADFDLRGPLGTTRVRVRSGEAWVVESPCPGQLCRRMGRIRGPGRLLVCVPNRVGVEFDGRAPGVDGVSR